MKYSYENQGINTYLVCETEENDVLDTMSLGMIINNKIPGFASAFFTQIDSTKYIKFNISKKVTLSQFFTGIVNRKKTLSVFGGILKSLVLCEDYMIDLNSVLLDSDYIYVDVSTGVPLLVCLPLDTETDANEKLANFFKNIMFTTQFDQNENCDYVGKIINYLNSNSVFSIYDFDNLLTKLEKMTMTGYTGEMYAYNNHQANTTNIDQTADSVNISQQGNTAFYQQPASAQHVNNQSVANYAQKSYYESSPLQQPPVQQPVQNNAQLYRPQANEIVLVQHQNVNQQTAPQVVQNAPEGVNIPGAKEFDVPGSLSDNAEPKKKGFFSSLFGDGKAKEDKKKEKEVRSKKASKEKDKKEKTKREKTASSNATSNAGGFAIPGQKTSIPMNEAPADKLMFEEKNWTVNVAQESHSKSVQQKSIQSQTANYNVAQSYKQVIPQGHSMNFGETVVLNAGMTGDTTVLNTSMLNRVPDTPYLTRIKTNEKVHINKPSFRIGKEKSFVDYFIGDNTAISRSHANIHERDGEYYIIDTNSTNHTYVDNQMVPSNQEYPIKSGAKIRLANEDFIFTIE